MRTPGIRTTLCLAVLAASVFVGGCGSDDDGGVTVKTSTNPGAELPPFPVRIIYQPDSPYGKRVTDAQLAQGIEILERRAKLLDLNDTRVRADKAGKIVITYAPKDFAKPANSQLPVQGRMLFYDFEADLVGSEEPIGEIYEAVTTAAKRPAVESPDNTTGKQYYLFGNLRNFRGGPTGSERTLLEKFAGKLPQGSEIKTVQPGTVVILASPLTNTLDPEQFNGNYILRDRPELDNSGIAAPEFSESSEGTAGGKPAVEFQFTREGRRQLQAMTAEIAKRGEREGKPGSFAVVFDNQLLSQATVDPKLSPNGLDGEDGASVYGDFDAEQAKSLAAVLQSGPLPFRMVPIVQTQVQSG